MGEWKAIRGQEDCENLLDLFGGFQDGCVRELHAWTGHYVDQEFSMACDPTFNLRMLVQRQWRDPSAIELVFGEVESIKWFPAKPDSDDTILNAWLFVTEGVLVWSLAPPEEFEEWTHVASRKLWVERSERVDGS